MTADDKFLDLLLSYGVMGQAVIFGLLAASAAWFLIVQGMAWRKDRIDRANAIRKPFFDKQFELMFETAEVASYIATGSDKGLWTSKVAEFWQLYYGKLCIVENVALNNAMVRFGSVLVDIGEDFSRREQLRNASHDVANA